MSKPILHFLMLSIYLHLTDREIQKLLREHQIVVNEFCQALFVNGAQTISDSAEMKMLIQNIL